MDTKKEVQRLLFAFGSNLEGPTGIRPISRSPGGPLVLPVPSFGCWMCSLSCLLRHPWDERGGAILIKYTIHHHHQPINVPTAGAQDFLMDGIGRLGHNPPRGPSADWFVGRYEFVNPMVVIKDIELIKKVAVKDFENFLDHRTLVDEKTDPICGRNLFSLNGQEWKDMRSTLSPAFTSSKMRQMLPFMVEVGNQMIESLKNKFKQAKTQTIDVDCKDLTTRFACDIIGTCAFGLRVDSFVEERNYFYEMGKLISHVDLIQLLLSFALFNFPNIVKATRFALSKDVTTKFFKHLVMNNMSERESQQIIRPDIIHLLMEAKKGRLLNDEKTTNGKTDDGFTTVEETNAGKKNTDTGKAYSF
ncbi:hypothetical protein evm_011204 [Chilo suppressalis]|nr:hypothetical protein evm_011204 [Chilo suppressalis]